MVLRLSFRRAIVASTPEQMPGRVVNFKDRSSELLRSLYVAIEAELLHIAFVESQTVPTLLFTWPRGARSSSSQISVSLNGGDYSVDLDATKAQTCLTVRIIAVNKDANFSIEDVGMASLRQSFRIGC